MRKAVSHAGKVYSILLIVFIALCTLGYALYLIYKLGSLLKTQSDETTEEKEVAEGTPKTGERASDSSASTD